MTRMTVGQKAVVSHVKQAHLETIRPQRTSKLISRAEKPFDITIGYGALFDDGDDK